MTAQLEAAVAEHEAARAELGDVLQAWQRDREELAEQIRWALCKGSERIAAAVLWRPALGWQDHSCQSGQSPLPILCVRPAGHFTTTWPSRPWSSMPSFRKRRCPRWARCARCTRWQLMCILVL